MGSFTKGAAVGALGYFAAQQLDGLLPGPGQGTVWRPVLLGALGGGVALWLLNKF